MLPRVCERFLQPDHVLLDLRVRDGRDEVAHESFDSLVLNFRRDRLNALVRQHAD